MKRSVVAVLFISFSLAAVSNDAVHEGRCFALIEKDTGTIERLELQNFSVLAQTNTTADFTLPVEVTARPDGVLCVRSSVIPAPNDYKVVVAGIPFNISTDEPEETRRVVVVEMSEGQFRVRLLRGELSDSEHQGIGQRLNEYQAATRSPTE